MGISNKVAIGVLGVILSAASLSVFADHSVIFNKEHAHKMVPVYSR